MLFHSIVAALATGLVAQEALASPLSRGAGLKRRQVPGSHALHERHKEHWARSWNKVEKVPASTVLPMRIGLKQSNLRAGHDKLMDISTPGSANYGKHMTAEEVIDFFAPHKTSADSVIDWLVDSGIERHRIGQSVNRQWIQFDATTEEVEDLLYTDFYVWEHVSGTHDISCDSYHIPKEVREHVDYVTPGTRLRSKRAESTQMANKKRDGAGAKETFQRVKPQITKLPGFPHPNSTTCDVYVTAECTRAQYDIPNSTTAAPGNELGIFESLDVHYSRVELDIYFSTLYPYIPNGTYPEERLIDGAIGAIEDPNPFNWTLPINLEAPLDFDSSWPLIWPQKEVLFQEDDEYYEKTGQFNGFWNTFLDAIDGSYCTKSAYGETGDCTVAECLDPAYPDPHAGGYNGTLQCGVYKPTNVISISYGGSEAALPDYYQKRQCDEFLKLALQGVTVVMSSGDSGVGDPDFCNGPDGKIFDPDFAASCPYVLAIGSTEWDRPDPAVPPTPYQKLNEVATARFPSGSGFSNIFGIPSYQRDAVSAYFDEVDLPFSGYHHYVSDGNFSTVTGGVYHHGGRGYPDVAAVGDRQLTYGEGSWYLVGGTSLSAPIWGAVLTLVNEARIAAGKSTVGFIHPVIYAHPEAFTDVTVGSSPGCQSGGFVTAKGWDPVTGLGSPNFPVLKEILLAL